MNVILTGASGFLGKIIQENLNSNFTITRVGREKSNDIICDLKEKIPIIPSTMNAVIHAAGKAHIYPKTEVEKKEFHEVNVIGTIHLLEALNDCTITHFVFISSVSVYGLEAGDLISENTPLKGTSPYAKSKIDAEEIIKDYCNQKGIHFILLRLPLIVGPNPLGNLGKMIDAIGRGRYVRIAKGTAKKSMVLASDVATLISSWLLNPKAASGAYNLTDGYHPTFFEMEEAIKNNLKARFIPSIPTWLGILLGKIGDKLPNFPVNSGTIKKITGSFTFSDKKAREEIQWVSKNVLDHIQ